MYDEQGKDEQDKYEKDRENDRASGGAFFDNSGNPYGSLYQSRNEKQHTSYVDYVSESTAPEQEGQPAHDLKKTFLKLAGVLAAVAVISVSSIEVYKLFGNSRSGWDVSTTTAETEPDESGALAEMQADSPDATGSTEAGSKDAEPISNPGSSANWIYMAAPSDSMSIPDIVEKALPSVVGISASFEYTPNSQSYWGFGFYDYGYGGSGQTQQLTGTGTGIVMTENGYVITNAHCIYDNESDYKCGKAVSVSVVMGDEEETEYEAQIVGYDLETDLAVLKIDAMGLTPAEFGDSGALRVGELVVAIGNPLGFELFGTTTCGIVSAINREVTINEKNMTLIQTDAAINSGNSGGPLLNCYGQVIGINSAKMSSTYGMTSVEGLGFAIPIGDAKEILEDLIDNGYVTGRPQLGITGVDVTESDAAHFSMPRGVYVYGVTAGSAAELAGIRQGDVITAIEDNEIQNMDELNAIKNQYNAGDTVRLQIYRSGETLELSLLLQEVKQEE